MEFTLINIVILIIAFWWSGFVRAGLGFGGAALMYPIALLAVDSVLFLVPIVAVQLLVLSSITLIRGYRNVDWKIVFSVFAIVFPTTLIGIFGLIKLPEFILLMLVYGIVIAYSISYIFSIRLKKPNKVFSVLSLLLGGYLAGLSLAGAPIIAAVTLRYLPKEKVRNSLFVLWILLVSIKLATLQYYQVDLQLKHQLWLFPCAIIGHLMGLKMHDRLLELDTEKFYRWMGTALFLVSILGVIKQFA